MPVTLKGLEVSEYRHGEDEKAYKAVEKVLPARKLGELLENVESKYNKRIEYLGSCVRLTPNNAPRIFKLMETAKTTLDYDGDIDLFCTRAYTQRIFVTGVDTPMVMFYDFIIKKFPDEMILFLFGQAITMVGGGMLKMFKLSDSLVDFTDNLPVAGKALVYPVGQWRRKAQMTIDRGGLLACQDYDAAMKYLGLLSGIPFRYINEIDINDRAEQLTRETERRKSLAENIGHVNNTMLSGRRSWANERFVELFNWYNSGEYGRIIAAHT